MVILINHGKWQKEKKSRQNSENLTVSFVFVGIFSFFQTAILLSADYGDIPFCQYIKFLDINRPLNFSTTFSPIMNSSSSCSDLSSTSSTSMFFKFFELFVLCLLQRRRRQKSTNSLQYGHLLKSQNLSFCSAAQYVCAIITNFDM